MATLPESNQVCLNDMDVTEKLQYLKDIWAPRLIPGVLLSISDKARNLCGVFPNSPRESFLEWLENFDDPHLMAEICEKESAQSYNIFNFFKGHKGVVTLLSEAAFPQSAYTVCGKNFSWVGLHVLSSMNHWVIFSIAHTCLFLETGDIKICHDETYSNKIL